jgi:hypothetical protein
MPQAWLWKLKLPQWTSTDAILCAAVMRILPQK